MRWSVVVVVVVVLATATARAQVVSPITNRNYAIELYDGVALGNSEYTAMGGAAAANASGSSGTLINPSASAVRSTTDRDEWSIDYHIDYLNGGLSKDYTNSGIQQSTTSISYATAGLALRVHDWAGAFTGTVQSTPLSLDGNAGAYSQTWRVRLAVAHWVPRLDIAFGATLVLASLDVLEACGMSCPALFTIQGVGLEAGAQWIPRASDLRLGVVAATPIAGGNVTATNCDPNNCDGYMLPDQVVSAWRITAGAAYRFAPTRWNQLVRSEFRDERALTLVADVVITGSTTNAFGLEAFGENELQRSGLHTAISPRGGAEYEVLPGRLRLRAGSYWEPSRFVDIAGRIHATFGIELRALEFHLWGLRRGKLELTGDVARDYENLGLSIGLWH